MSRVALGIHSACARHWARIDAGMLRPRARLQSGGCGAETAVVVAMIAAAAAGILAAVPHSTSCSASSNDDADQRKRLQAALALLRPQEKAMRERWVKEEEGFFKLPPRAWPTVQPKADEIPALRDKLQLERCPPPGSPVAMSESCAKLTFDLASALVFTASDGLAGLSAYRALAATGHLDAKVAVGVILVEGLAGPRDHEEGVRMLREATDAGSAQGSYELGTLSFIGGADLEEDEPGAYDLFQRAAGQRHRDGMFMVGDCLLEGVGVAQDWAAAVPYLYGAALLGHRGARQHLRQLLDGRWMGFDGAGGPARIVL